MKLMKKPELLAPAGSFEALEAAISAGADAIYAGLSRFNARSRAENFGHDKLAEAVKLCKLHKRKLYLTLNTLVFDKELDDVVSEAKFCAEIGVDALIVQDLGLMTILSHVIPEIPLHASTQCATHNLDQIYALAELGVKRAVVARELSEYDLEKTVAGSPIEIEVFVHGAMCMSHSGTCLMSSYLGGRSGNRGECAQPCRLPYSLGNSSLEYPLSLRDLSLGSHVRELCQIGVSSFKIEGRMKSPEYVYKTTQVFRRLIDEGRNASPDEIKELEMIFSRNGFTDGYYTGKKGVQMFGVRQSEDKKKTSEAEKDVNYKLGKIPVRAFFTQKGDRARLIFSKDGISGESECEAVCADNGGTDREIIAQSISKLGDTPFVCNHADIFLESPVFFKRSVLNALRREAIQNLEKTIFSGRDNIPERSFPPLKKAIFEKKGLWVIFERNKKISSNTVESLLSMGAEKIFLPLFSVEKFYGPKSAVVLPRAVFEKDSEEFTERLKTVYDMGYRTAFAENLGVGMMAQKCGFAVIGGAGLNAVNSYSLSALESFGFKAVVLSGELTEIQKKNMKSSMPIGDTVWGKAPLMLIENCVMGTRDGCFWCKNTMCLKSGVLCDRKGEKFPVLPDSFHRAVIYNSRPTYRADRENAEAISFGVIYITDEKDAEKIFTLVSKKSEITDINFKFTRK